MKSNFCFKVISVVVLLPLSAWVALGQTGVQGRGVNQDDLTALRKGNAGTAAPARKYTYRVIKVVKPSKPPKPPVSTQATNAGPVVAKPMITRMGVTIWKLRPPLAEEVGFTLFPVKDSKGQRQNWLAERIPADYTFSVADKVRLAVESSVEGYLYVIDREILSDNTLGDAYLNFPESSFDNNMVGPGVLFDMPDQNADPPTYDFTPLHSKYAGERLTIIISATPITNIRTNADGKITNSEVIKEMEDGADFEIKSRDDRTDNIYTKAEAEAACGSLARKGVKPAASANPCGTKSRQLKRGEPAAQSVYVINGFEGKPAVAFVNLQVKP